MVTVETSPRGFRRRPLPLLSIVVLSTAFGAISGSVVDASVAMAGFGLLWGAVALALAPRAARVGARSAMWADAPVAVAAALALVVVGGSIQALMQYTSASATVVLLQQSSSYWFFPVLHGLFEWVLLPAVLMLNWTHRTRRNLLLVTAVVFYLGRISSALYFAPHVFEWVRLPFGAPLSVETLEDVQLWIKVNWLRFVFQDVLVAGLLLLAQYRGVSGLRAWGAGRHAARHSGTS